MSFPSGVDDAETPAYPQSPNRRASMLRFQRGASVSYTLLGITIAIYALQMLTEVALGHDLPALLGIKADDLIIAGQWWRLLTPVFLHGSILHLGFNMYALYVLGPMLERYYGHVRFLVLYLLAGFAGNVLSMIMTPAPSLGSSTAIFGLLAAQGVFLYQNRAFFGDRARPALINILTVALINFIIGLSPGIDNWGHLGGLMGGLAFAWFGGPALQVAGWGYEQSLVDARDRSRVLLAGLGVFLVFAALAFIWISRQ